MHSRPSKAAESIVAILVPTACREEVLGDLHEQYRSPQQYALNALRTVPLVIISRVRRTADAQLLLIQAFAMAVSFLGAAWFKDGGLLSERWGLLRLATPVGMAMLGLILEDAYAHPGQRSPLSMVRGPVLGLGLALVSQSVFWAKNPDFAVPLWVLCYGCAMSLLLSSTVRMLFPPGADQLQGANAPALWLKQAGGSVPSLPAIIRVAKGTAAIVAIGVVGTLVADEAALPKPRVVIPLLVVLISYQISKRR